MAIAAKYDMQQILKMLSCSETMWNYHNASIPALMVTLGSSTKTIIIYKRDTRQMGDTKEHSLNRDM